MIQTVPDPLPRRGRSNLGRGLSLPRLVWSMAMVLVVSVIVFRISYHEPFALNEVVK